MSIQTSIFAQQSPYFQRRAKKTQYSSSSASPKHTYKSLGNNRLAAADTVTNYHKLLAATERRLSNSLPPNLDAGLISRRPGSGNSSRRSSDTSATGRRRSLSQERGRGKDRQTSHKFYSLLCVKTVSMMSYTHRGWGLVTLISLEKPKAVLHGKKIS